MLSTHLKQSFIKSPDTLKIINSKQFRKIDPNTNDSFLYDVDTIGEFFITALSIRIFSGMNNRKELINLINTFCILLTRGYLTQENINLVNNYISYHRMPKLLRCVIKIILNKYTNRLKFTLKTKLSKIVHPGIENIIISYILK